MKFEKIFGIVLVIGFLFILGTSVSALKILEPVTKNLEYTNQVDIGYVSSEEYWLVSFLLEEGDDYTNISVSKEQANNIIIDNIKKTKESIYCVIKIDDDISGNYTLDIILSSKTKEKNIKLNVNVTDKVIHTVLENYNKQTIIERTKRIPITLLNKSNSTKNVIITSDLSNYWFDKENIKTKRYILQPNSENTIYYKIIPQILGEKSFNIYIQSVIDKDNQLFNTQEDMIIYNINIDVKKDLRSIYASKKHSFPLYNQNILPIYFFNKIIKLI